MYNRLRPVRSQRQWQVRTQHRQQVVHFRSLEKPKEDDFCLALSMIFTYDDVTERVARHLGLHDSTKIRLTSHNCYSQQPKPQPIKYQGVDHLSDMLVHYDQISDILYYEVLDIPLPELQGLKTLKVNFHHATKNEVFIHSIRLPKQCTVADVINDLKTKVELSHPNAELRLLEVFYHKIYKIFPLSEEIEKINDQYWTLRAEEIPEEEKNLGPHDQLIHIYHFTKDGSQNQMQVQNFGVPFFLKISERETLAEVKVRIQKKLQVPNDEFSKWKFAFLSLGRPDYLQDYDIVSSRFQRRDIYGAWEQYLGLEHSDSAAKRAYATNQDNKILVPHSENTEDPELMEALAQACIVSTVENQPVPIREKGHPLQIKKNNQPIKDPPAARFTWRIENFSRLNTKKLYSDVFTVGSHKWRMLIFPKGNNVDHLSMYLDVADPAKLPYGWSRCAQFCLGIVNQIHNKCTVRKYTQHQFTAGESDWGFTSFMPLSELYDPSRGYLVNDTCIFEAEVVVVHGVMDNSTFNSKKVVYEMPTVKNDMPSGSIPLQSPALSGNSKETNPKAEVECVASMSDEVVMPAPPTQLSTLTPLTKYSDAGQLFEEGRHGKGILDEKYEDIGGFSVLKTQASLYKQIWLKYGHIASSRVLTDSYSGQVMVVSEIMTSIMDMHHRRLAEVSSAMIDSWEKKIKMAEKLEFNIRWLRECFEDVKKDFYGEQKLKTRLLEQDQSLQAAKERLKKAQDLVSAIETRISSLLSERQMYQEKGTRLLLDGLL